MTSQNQLISNLHRPRKLAPEEIGSLIRRTALRLLRHNCRINELNHDFFGLIPLESLINILRKRFELRVVGNTDTMIQAQLSQLEIREQIEFRCDKVRALYGHSLSNVIVGALACPPPSLFHTTAKRHLEAILQNGLRKRSRSYIHLTSRLSYATDIALSASLNHDPILLEVDTQKCLDAEASFRKPNSHVWLTNRVPSAAIRVVTQDSGWWLQSGNELWDSTNVTDTAKRAKEWMQFFSDQI